jgi:hypothetical protein
MTLIGGQHDVEDEESEHLTLLAGEAHQLFYPMAEATEEGIEIRRRTVTK